MAKVIEFHIPRSFRKSSKWFPEGQQAKLLEFPPPARKSARETLDTHTSRTRIRPGQRPDEIQGLRHRWKESSFATCNCAKHAYQLDLHETTMSTQAAMCERACARN
jgi:hypothetical protein